MEKTAKLHFLFGKPHKKVKYFYGNFWHVAIEYEGKIYETFSEKKYQITPYNLWYSKNSPQIIITNVKINTKKLKEEIKSGTDCATYVARVIGMDKETSGSQKNKNIYPEHILDYIINNYKSIVQLPKKNTVSKNLNTENYEPRIKIENLNLEQLNKMSSLDFFKKTIIAKLIFIAMENKDPKFHDFISYLTTRAISIALEQDKEEESEETTDEISLKEKPTETEEIGETNISFPSAKDTDTETAFEDEFEDESSTRTNFGKALKTLSKDFLEIKDTLLSLAEAFLTYSIYSPKEYREYFMRLLSLINNAAGLVIAYSKKYKKNELVETDLKNLEILKRRVDYLAKIFLGKKTFSISPLQQLSQLKDENFFETEEENIKNENEEKEAE